MKKLWGCILVFAVLLTGCRSASVLSFDVWRPAKVTFPADIVRVTVVNNSAEPNEKEGNKFRVRNIRWSCRMTARLIVWQNI